MKDNIQPKGLDIDPDAIDDEEMKDDKNETEFGIHESDDEFAISDQS